MLQQACKVCAIIFVGEIIDMSTEQLLPGKTFLAFKNNYENMPYRSITNIPLDRSSLFQKGAN